MSKKTVSERVRDVRQELLMAMRGISGLTKSDVSIDDKGNLDISFEGWSPALARIRVTTTGFYGPSGDQAIMPYLDQVIATQAARAREAHARYGRYVPFNPGEPDHLATILVDDAICHLIGEDYVMEAATKRMRSLHNQAGVAAGKYTGGSTLYSTGGHLIEVPCDKADHCNRILGMTVKLQRSDLETLMWFDGANLMVHRHSLPNGIAAAAVGKPLRDVVEMPAWIEPSGLPDKTIIAIETERDRDGAPQTLRITLRPILRDISTQTGRSSRALERDIRSL